MSIGLPFVDDSLLVKFFTNREGDGLARSASPQSIHGGGAPTPRYAVSVRERPSNGGDHSFVHTGPGAGVAQGVTSPGDIQGFVSPTGNKVLIDNTFGSDTITLQHHSGATILIDADGAIHLISTGKKGVGVISPRGDGTVHAANHLILSGDGKLTIETKGDLDINVGGHLAFNVGGDITSHVRGSSEEVVGGTKMIDVVKDFVTMTAGDQSHSSAGNYKIQSSSAASLDAAKDIDIRTDAQMKTQVQADHIIIVKGDSTNDVKGKFTTTTEGDTKHQTKGTFDILAKGDSTFNTKGSIGILSEGAATIQTKASMDIASGANMQAISGGQYLATASSTMGLYAGSTVKINGSTTDIQNGGSPITPPDVSAEDAGDVKDALKAQYAPANTIIDSLTSIRVAPDFPQNAKFMTANEMSLYKNEGGTPNPKAVAYAAGNKGGGMQAAPGPSAGGEAPTPSQGPVDIPPGIQPNGKAEKNPLDPPTSIYNSNQKISKHITLGQVLGLRDCPAANHQAVIKEAMNTAWNIFDPLIEKFGAKVQITSWYRNPPRANHPTGGAVDFRCSNREDYNTTGEMAAWIRDNLPYEQLFLEKNDQGSIHCHVKAAQPGAGASGNVMTCSDSACSGKVQGIQLSYAVAALKGKVA